MLIASGEQLIDLRNKSGDKPNILRGVVSQIGDGLLIGGLHGEVYHRISNLQPDSKMDTVLRFKTWDSQ